MKRTFILAVFMALLAPWAAHAQGIGLANYTFATGTSADKWVTLTTTDNILTSTGDNSASMLQDIGFSFDFGGTEYSRFSVNSDGNLRLGNTVTGTGGYSTPFSSSNANTNAPKINFMGCDGYLTDTGHVYKELFTLPTGERMLVVEFYTQTYNTTSRAGMLKWQVHLYESGKIEVVYGTAPSVMPNVARQPGMCINGTDIWLVSNTHAATHYTSAQSSNSCTSGTWPEAGRYYTFTPPVLSCPPARNLAISNLMPESFDFSWNESGTASSYLLTLTPGGINTVVNTTSYSFTGLTDNTAYTLTLQTICSATDSSEARVIELRTPCYPVSTSDLPYTYGFEDATGAGSTNTFNACLGRYTNNSSTAYPYPSSTANRGSYGLYMYSTSSYYSYLTLPLFEEDITNLHLSFWAYKTSTSYGHVYVGVMSDPSDLSTFDTVATFQVENTSMWELMEVNFENYSGTGTYIAILSPSMSSASYVNIDDIIVGYPPTCIAPESVELDTTTLTSTSASFEITHANASDFFVLYRMVNSDWQSLEVTGTTFDLIDLVPGMHYELRVYTTCGADTSEGFVYTTFTAGCAPLTYNDLPYFETFESYGTGSSQPINGCWNKGTNGSTAYPYPYSTAAINGNRGIYLYGNWPSTSTGARVFSWFTLPELDPSVNISNLMVEFMVKRGSTASNYYTTRFLVGIADSITAFGTADGIDSTVVWIDTIDLFSEAANSIHTLDVNFSQYTGDGRYIVFYAPVPSLVGSATYAYNYVYLDDIVLRETPTCFRPTTVSVDSVGVEEVYLSWVPDERTPSPNWIVEYGHRGFTPGEGSTETTSDTSIVLTNLDEATEYDVYVYADCGGETSDARTAAFMTEATPATMPYFTGFEADQDSGWIFVNDGQTNYWMVGTDTAHTGSHSLYITNNGVTNNYTISSASTVYAYRSLNIQQPGEYVVSFDWRAYGESTYDYLRAFIVPADVTVAAGNLSGVTATATPDGWTSVTSFNDAVKLNLSSDWEINLSTFFIDSENTGIYKLLLLWRNDGSGGSVPPAVVDNINVYRVNCQRPTDVAVDSIGANEIHLTWRGDADSYEVQYSTAEDFGTNVVTVTTTDTAAALTGLAEFSRYYLRLRGFCGSDTSFWSYAITVHTHVDCGPNNRNILDTIGEGASASNSYTFYCTSSYSRSFTAAIFTAEELSEMGLLQNNRINGISLHSGSTGGTINQAKIYMKEVDIDAFGTPVANDTVDRTTMSLVKSGDLYFDSYSWNYIEFDTAFEYSGNSALMVLLARDTAVSSSLNFYYTTSTPNYRNVYTYLTSSGTFNTPVRTYLRPDMAFNICTEVPLCLRPVSLTVNTVTDTSATLSWTAASSSYEVMVSTTPVDPDSVANPTVYTVSNDTTTITGLAENTVYYWYVRSLCTGNEVSLWSIEGTFRTACAPLALPYSEDFESYASGSNEPISVCWYKGTNSTTAYPYPSSTNAVNGSRSLYMMGYLPSSTTTVPTYSYAALPMFDAPVDTLMLTLKARRYSSTADNYTSLLVVGVMDNPNDISTFTPVDTLDLKNERALSVHGFDVSFENYNGNGRYIAIYAPVPPLYGTSNYCYNYVYVDDVEVYYIPSCARVTDVTFNNITRTSVTVDWSAVAGATSYSVQYGPQGFDLGSGTTLTATTNSLTITGLDHSTLYDVYVSANCSATDQGAWSFVKSFASACAPLALPLFYDMESYPAGTAAELPLCWNRLSNGTGNYTYYPYVYTTSSTYAHSGTKVLYFYTTTTSGYPTEEMMVFPEIDTLSFPINNVEFSFWARGGSYGNRPLILGVMTDPTDTSTFTAVDTIRVSTTIEEYTMNTSSYSGYGSYVALKTYKDTTVSVTIYVDDIFIGAISPCPRVYDLTVSNGTATTVDLGWTDTIGSSQWVVEYGVLGGATSTVTVNTNPYTLTGLTPGTDYTFRVAPICASGSQADWSRAWLNFNTAFNPATVPYSYDFETSAEWNNWKTASNNNVNWYRGNVAQDNSTNALYLSADSGATHSWNMNTVSNVVAYRDIDFGTAGGSFQIDYDVYVGGTISANYDGLSVLLVDPATYVESSSAGLISPWGSVNGNITMGTVRRDTSWNTYSAYFDNISGVKRLVFYHFNQATGSSHPYYDNPPAVDNISITVQPCTRPYDLEVLNQTLTSVTLAWEGDDSASYQVSYRLASGTTTTNTYATTNTNSITLTGLTASSNFYWWVRKICTLTATDTLVSAFSAGSTFRTPCAIVSAADTIFEDFESYEGTAYNAEGILPNCWEGYNASGTLTPHITNGDIYSYTISGTKAVTMTSGTSNDYTGGTDNYLRLVDIAEPTNTLTVAFWMCTESPTNGFLEVGYVTGTNYATDFVALKRIAASTATQHDGNGLQVGHGIFDTVSFSAAPAGNYPICFRWNYTTSYYSVSLDNIAVWTSQVNCHEPIVLDTTVLENSVTFNWSGSASNYEVAVAEGTWDESTLTAIPVADTVYTFTSLTANTQYTIGVRALCGSSNASDWVTVSVTTLEHPCFVPTAVTVSDVTFNSAVVSWTPGENETTWEVNVTGPSYDQTFTTTTIPYTVSGLASNETFTVKVRAICSETQQSDWSATAQFTTERCQPVSGVTSTATTFETATVSWNPASNGSGNYELEYGLSGFRQGDGTRVTVTGATTYAITGLEEETNYDVYVRSICAAGLTSEWSSVSTFTTPQSDGIDDVDAGTAISLYPNPATTTVTLNGLEPGAKVTIVDLNGREVLSLTTDDSTLTTDVSSLTSGAYFVRVTGERQTAVRKLIVK